MKRIYQRMRRFVAVFLAVSMVCSLAGPGGVFDFTVFAAASVTELPSDDLGEGVSDTLAYKWKDARDHGDGNLHSYRYNIRGLKAGENSYDEGSWFISYQDAGFPTYLFMPGPGRTTPPRGDDFSGIPEYHDPGVLLPANYYMAKLGQRDSEGNRITNFDGTYYNGVVEKTTFGQGSGQAELESRITTTTSPDGKYVFVDYYVSHVGGTVAPDGVTMWLGSNFDLNLGNYGNKDVYKTSRGFYAMDSISKATVDVITNDSRLGISTPPSTRWVGSWVDQRDYMLTESDADFILNDDNSMAFSWEFKIRPYETVHRRIAFGTKESAYYVSTVHGKDQNPDGTEAGTFQHPFKTIEFALAQCNGKNAYIYIQDYKAFNQSIEVAPTTFDENTSVTIASSDMDIHGNSIVEDEGYIQILQRASGYTGSLFKQTGNSTVKFTDITLEGNSVAGESPLITASAGTLQINGGTTLRNNNGGAVVMEGNSNLYMNGGESGVTVTNNISENGAICFNSNGNFNVLNRVTIKDNKKADEIPANVYLSAGKYISVDGDLEYSTIGVTTETLPAASPEGESYQQDQEIRIAGPSNHDAGFDDSNWFAANFFADLSTQGLSVSNGTASLGNREYAVIKQEGNAVSFLTVDADTGGSIAGASAIPECYFARGSQVNIDPPEEIAGYTLKHITIDQGSGNSLICGTAQNSDFGRITGTMPPQNVTISYEYTKDRSAIFFQANGGTPQPPALEGNAGSPITALMPRISRYGYIFLGWSTVNDWEDPNFVTDLPTVFPEGPITYYAVFEPDPDVTFNYTVEYSNRTGDTVFQSVTEEQAYKVETLIQAQKQEIHGYIWSLADSGTTPNEYNYSGISMPIGQFNGLTGEFSGSMPGQDVTVRYRYRVDHSSELSKSPFTVRYETVAGTVVSDTGITAYYPEETIAVQPAVLYGYECVGGRIDAGDTADGSEGPVSILQGGFDGSLNFNGVMPNQPVTITYLYEPTDEGYNITVEHVDNGTLDERLKNIREPLVHVHRAEESIGLACAQGAVEYRVPYGYNLVSKLIIPSSSSIHWSGNDFTGTMPNDSVNVSYHYSRVSALWTDIAYRAGVHGSLTAESGVSPDVQIQGDGSFKTSILTETGAEEGYTLEEMKVKRLIPVAKPDPNYRFEGWYIDINGNGVLDDGESLLDGDQRFTGDTVLTALFAEDPAKWIDIHFEAGLHGSINMGENLSLHTTVDKKWSDIEGSLPQYTPEANYLRDGWYTGEKRVNGEMNLENEQIYTIRFRQDPEVFGTDVAQPEVLAGLNTQGKGRLTVFNTTSGYRYILTDLSGKILEVSNGNALTDRVMFDNLYPGEEYKIYEAPDYTEVQKNGQIEDVAEPLSTPAELLTPVLDTNYQIIYDEENEGKTVLIIKPADSDSEYAVLDNGGHVVGATVNGGFKRPSGSQTSLTFMELNYNSEYTVVARPFGKTDITAESLKNKGSVITADPGGELELPQYIIETQNGEILKVGEESVGAGRYEQAYKGDRVVITAESINEDGETFSHWKVIIGTAGNMGGSIAQREASFTMPGTNVVLTAVYERPKASPSNATVVDEVRGGKRKETALDPNEIPRLEEELTTAADEELLTVNHSNVTYKTVYRRNTVKASESNAVKASGSYEMDHKNAYKGAWGLDVLIERYVNGRKAEGATEPEASFRTYIQMGQDDVDMLDYQLYEITENPVTGETEANLITMEADPEETGGLFAFTAHAGSRYIMVYNRAYRLHFINNVVLPIENRYRYSFRVRRDESPEDTYYSNEFGQVEAQVEYFVSSDGAEYVYNGWSYDQNRYKEFDPLAGLRKKTYVYAYYKDNLKEVDDTRKKLEDAIKDAIRVSDDYFLKEEESEAMKKAVEEALTVLDRENPKATAGQMDAALEELKEKTKPYEKILDDRYNHYDDIQDNGNKGGNKGGGGSGGGTKKEPYNSKLQVSYIAGTNGNWIEISAAKGEERQMAFVLNGGMKLSGMWAWILDPTDGSKRTGWYHFNSKGIMETGWISDGSGNWYYCNRENEGNFGMMQTGWRQDNKDGNWYYLLPDGGAMATGWREIEENWYYFETVGAGAYVYDPQSERWNYGGGTGKPLGSMYKNEMTSDGFVVNNDGVWLP